MYYEAPGQGKVDQGALDFPPASALRFKSEAFRMPMSKL